ncbi:MAG: DNA mismatch repair protein MutL [Gracilibacter sp. BRH_c7a]|nr:MAG: DNA mismatch repair protein MutL [Gracilibacter sp. BRH_c7a]
MNPKIRILDQHCVNQIAAGEVIERPLSVIKELVENSLDALANKVEITVEGRGTSLIRIKDNGIGINPEDLCLAVKPHATSKIGKIEDLDSLNSLGFRGEALASIASVSKLSIVSRTRDQIAATEIRIEGGQVISTSEVGSPAGTTVTVEDLFFNTPARLKFLSSDSTEFGLISDMVGRLALARPDVSFSLRRPNNLIFNTAGLGDLLDGIASVLGNDTARKLIPIEYNEGNLSISGFISPPDFSRSSRQGITFIVNGRVIRSKLLNSALKNGYHTLLPSNMYPTAVINLSLPPAEYDVNVHPAKMEIKFKSERNLSQVLTDTVRKTLLGSRPLTRLSLVSDEQKPYPQIKKSDLPGHVKSNSWEQIRMQYSSKTNYNPKINYSSKTGINSTINDNLIPQQPEANPVIPNEKDDKNSFFQDLRPIGQLFSTYILTTDDKGLYIIDQHAAHERIRYENILDVYRNTKTASQTLLIPEIVELTLQEEQLILAHYEELYNLGFILEHFGERTYFLRGVPILNNLEAPQKMFKLFVDEIINNPIPPSSERLIEKWIFVLACRSAIKANDRLSLLEMEELLMKLGKTNNPYSCPHGRPIIIEISKKELENKFNR